MQLLNILVLILGIPIGLLVRFLAKEELKQGKKYFRILIISSILLGILFYLYGIYYMTLTMAFILIVSLISFLK